MPCRICCACGVVPRVPMIGRRVVIGGVSLVCRYLESFALRMAFSTADLVVCRMIVESRTSETSIIGPVVDS